jgi:hypothetical protein
MDQNAQAQVLKALLRQRGLLDQQIQELVDSMIRSTSQQQPTPAPTAEKQTARRKLSPAARKKVGEATRKRWELYRQAKAAGNKKAARKTTKQTSTKKSPAPAKSS